MFKRSDQLSFTVIISGCLVGLELRIIATKRHKCTYSEPEKQNLFQHGNNTVNVPPITVSQQSWLNKLVANNKAKLLSAE